MKKHKMTYKKLFWIFLKAGLAFGGGLAVIFAMEEELVQKHRLMSKKEFMDLFALARIVPAGGVTAIAIAIGYKYKKFKGTLIALFAVMLPAFVLTVGLAALYSFFKASSLFGLFNYSIMPAAVGLIVISAISMGKDIVHSPLLIAFAVAAFIATFFFGMNVAMVILAGAILGVIVFSNVKEGHDLPY
ncbi:MAG TPA: chromate transporter [Patescibacteria group bacterium]|nr:chromate transporter [Patescibacteria group bacterium]